LCAFVGSEQSFNKFNLSGGDGYGAKTLQDIPYDKESVMQYGQ